MKKIAIVIADLELGGGQRIAITLANELAKKNKLKIIVFQDKKIHFQAPQSMLISLNCPSKNSIPGKIYNIFKRAYKLRKVIKKERFNEVYAFMETANFPTAIAFPDAALSVHCNPMVWNIFETILAKITYPRAKNIVAVSDDVANILRSEYDLKNVSHIYNPINPKDILAQVDKPYQHSKPYIVALGRYNEMKRYDLLIEKNVI